MKEKACVAPPQGDAEPMIQLTGAGGIYSIYLARGMMRIRTPSPGSILMM